MKKFYLLLIISAMASLAFAQNAAESLSIKKHFMGIENNHKSRTIQSKDVILTEDFETAALPTDWSKVDGACGWLFGAAGSSAYFVIPDHTNYAYVNDDACNGDMADVQLITPSMDLTGLTDVVLEFASINGGDTYTIKASTDGGTTWTDVQTVDDNAEWTTVQVLLTDYEGESDVKIMFHYNDGGVWGYGWAIDDVTVYTLDAVDAAVTAVTPELVFNGESAYPEVTITNNGASVIDAMDITVVINDGTSDVYTSTLNLTTAALASITSETYTMTDEWTPANGNYTITATVAVTGDADATNDEMEINTEVRDIAFGDCVSYFDTDASGCPGIETDGNFIYTVYWNSTNAARYFDRYTMDGTFVEGFEVTGAIDIRDMAYNPNTGYFYGAAANTSLFEMDFTQGSEALVSTITAATASRAIAYDDDDMTFWANNWDSNLTEFGLDGTATGNSFVSPSIYGAAYDNWSDPENPTMWLFVGTGGDTQTALVEYSLDGTATGRVIDISSMPGFNAGVGSGSGGLASYEEGGIAYLLANTQMDPNRVYKIYLADATTNIDEINVSNIQVYPNPANNVVNVVNAENASIIVINMVGEIVVSIDNASANQSIDISNLANGTYFVKVNDSVVKFNVIK